MRGIILSLLFVSSSVFAAKMNLDTSKSVVTWTGQKILVKDSHTGTVNVSSGYITVDKSGNITGGEFVVDMTSIKNKDVKNATWRGKLEAHLKSADFFDVKNSPTATFKIKSVKKAKKAKTPMTFDVLGMLTLRKVEKPITFQAQITKAGKVKVAKAKFVIDRTLWGVKYNSPKFFSIQKLKDKAIDNNITLELDLKTKA